MTDDQMDAQLRAAGERWQTANSAAVEPPMTTTLLMDDSGDGLGGIARRPRSRRTWLAVAASVVLLGAAAVGVGLAVVGDGTGGSDGHPAGGGVASTLRGAWTLESFTPSPSGDQVRIEAPLSVGSDGELVANDGCNTMSGKAEIDADTITVHALATTLVACTGQDAVADAFSNDIHGLFDAPVHWSVAGDRLTLTNGSTVLTYRRFDVGGSHDPNLLPGTVWQLNTVAEDGADGSASSSSDYQGITIRFTGAPAFVVTYLCVTESGQVAAGDGKLTLKVLDTRDAKPCPSTSSETDQQVRQRLTGPITWTIVAGQLVITKDGVGSLTFEGVAQSTSSPGPITS